MPIEQSRKRINIIQELPFPASGLMLGLAAMGALLQPYAPVMRVVCGMIAVVIAVLLLLKVLSNPKEFVKAMQHPVTASVMGTYSMTCMLLATYGKDYFDRGKALWYIGIFLQIALVFYFTGYFIVRLRLERVYASYFIVYSGIAMISATAPVFGEEKMGHVVVWCAIVPVICLIPIIAIRYIKLADVQEQFKPLFCVFAAPVNLCLVGYIRCAEEVSIIMMWILWLIGTCLYLVVLWFLPTFLKLPFYPSYSAFTFPFIATATATEALAEYYADTGGISVLLKGVFSMEMVLAASLAVYTLVQYILFVKRSEQQGKEQECL